MKKARKAFSLVEISIAIVIIAVLIAGVTRGKSLVNKSRLATARNLTQNAPILSIDGLALWLESTRADAFFSNAAATSNVAETGELIFGWRDLNRATSILTRLNPIQTVNNNQPTYVENGINALPCASFNGTSNFLELENVNLSNLTSGNAMTIFIVFAPAGAFTPSTQIFWGTATAGESIRLGNSAATEMTFDFGGTSLVSTNFSTGANIIVATRKPVTAASAKTMEISRNSVTADASSASTPTISTPASASLSIGATSIAGVPSAGTYMRGLIGEIIIFKTYLDPDDRLTVQRYLEKKWGI